MKNMVPSGTSAGRTHNQDVATSNRSNSDFANLMNYFWNYMDMPSNAEIASADLEPRVQVAETKDAVNVTAELPGINEKDLDLRISSDGFLSISGEKTNTVNSSAKDAYFSEISYGMFKRTIPLPWDLDYENAAATYNNGVLNVSIPKTQVEKQKFKTIAVKTTNKN